MTTHHSSDEVTHECPICCERIDEVKIVTSTPCSHIMHKDCLDPWLVVKNSCPVCRAPVVPKVKRDDTTCDVSIYMSGGQMRRMLIPRMTRYYEVEDITPLDRHITCAANEVVRNFNFRVFAHYLKKERDSWFWRWVPGGSERAQAIANTLCDQLRQVLLEKHPTSLVEVYRYRSEWMEYVTDTRIREVIDSYGVPGIR